MQTTRRTRGLGAALAVLAGLGLAAAAGAVAPFAPPDPPVQLYVGATSAQAGSGARGNPVVGIDLTPVFSAVVAHPDAGGTLTDARVQVAADHAFVTPVWTSGWLDISGTASGARTPDLAYAGPALAADTRYWWRIESRDSLGAPSGWSDEPASFFTGAASALLTTVSTFPWRPGEDEEATVWIPNFPTSGLTPSGSVWRHGVVAGDRRGTTGAGAVAWSPSPTADYLPDTVTWLHSPRFDMSGVAAGALQLRFELWIKAMHRFDGCKLQVSTDGGSTWSDVTATSVPYNGNTGNSNLLSTVFGGSDDGWTKPGGQLAGTTARTVILDLSAVAGQADVRYRFGFVSDATNHREGPVLDGFRIVPAVTGDDLFQDTTATVTITGAGFTGATGVAFCDPLISVNSFTVVNDTTITASVTTGALATAGDTCFTVQHPSGNIDGSLLVVYPTDIDPVTSDVEPVNSAAIGGVGVFLASGEFIRTEVLHATRGRVYGVTWDATYQSNTQYQGPLGAGWTSHFFQRVRFDGATSAISWFTPGGRTEVFTWTGTAYAPPPGVYWTATRDAVTGQITLRHRHGERCVFGADGRLQFCEDRNFNRVTLVRNPVGQPVEILDDRGFRHEVWWAAHGRAWKIVDYVWSETTPREVELGYDTAGNRVSLKQPETARYSDAAGARLDMQCAYDASHRMLTCTNAREVASGGPPWLTNTYENGRVIQQQVGTAGQNIFLRYVTSALVRQVDRRGLRTDFTLDSAGRATSVAQHTGFWAVDTVAPIDPSVITQTGAKLRATDPDSFVTNYAINADHEVTSVTYPRGNSVEFSFQPVTTNPDVRGNVIEVRRKDNALGSEPDIVTTASYEPLHQFVASSTDGRGFTTTYTHDTRGNRLTATAPTITLGQPTPQVIVTSRTFNQFGQPVNEVDGEGFTTQFVYFAGGDRDGFLQQVIVDAATLQLTTEYDYNRAGDVIARASPRAREGGGFDPTFQATFEVNELGQTWHVTGPVEFVGGSARSEVYRFFDANGLLDREYREYIAADGTQPAPPVDPHNPATFTKAAVAMAATWVETSHAYNLLNYRTSSAVDAIAGAPVTRLTTQFEFDDSYNQTAVLTPLLNRTETAFDERDLVFTVKEGAGSPAEGIYRTDYNLNAYVAGQVDALGNVITTLFDGFERVVRTTDPADHYVTQAYDADSNPTVTEQFDAADTLLARTNQFWDEISRSFNSERLAKDKDGVNIGDGLDTTATLHDRNSRVTTVTDDNAVVTTFEFDGANRRTATRDNLANEVRAHYNLDSAVTTTDYVEQNPLTMAAEESHTEAVLDFLNRRIAWRDQRFNAVTRDTQVDYALDGWGRVVTITDAASVETSYEFDLLSRKTGTVRKPAAAPSTWIVTRHAWDDDSRLVENQISTDGAVEADYQVTSYGYDARHRRIFTRLPDYQAAPESGVVAYTYNAQNPTGWTDLLGTQVVDTHDPRNLIAQRTITRGAGVLGATRETYLFDGLGRLASAVSYETRAASEDILVAQAWTYNTLSHAEQHVQALYDHAGNTLGTFTTAATFDAVGLTKSTHHATGLDLVHFYDGLNRLAATNIAAGGELVAAYAYSGPFRLIRRDYGNGNRTTVGYEVAGCPCAGFSAFVEDVHHIRSPADPTTLVRTERRYDVLGNVTAERWGHRGNLGSVFRYDDTYRLTDTYAGVDLTDPNLDTFANPATTPTAYTMRRHYGLDTRGNRTLVTDTDDAAVPNTLRTVGYSPNSDTNVYDSVDGASFTYDDAEQLTRDPTTNVDTAYNYRGQPVAVDGNADFSSPEERTIYDAQGRVRVKARYSGGAALSAEAYTYLPETGSPPMVADQIEFVGAGGTFTPSGDTLALVCGMGAAGSGGCGGATNPRTATRLPGGSTIGSFVILELATDGVTVEERWILEDQLGSTLGITDASGALVRLYHSTDYGLTTSQPLAFASRAGAIASTSHSGGTSTLTLAGSGPPTAGGTRPIRGHGSSACGTIIDVTASTITVWDPQNTFAGLAGGQFTIGDAVDPHAPVRDDPVTHDGTVSAAVVAGPETHMVVAGADFSGVPPGAPVHLTLDFGGGDVQEHWTEVLGVPALDTITVRTLPEYSSPVTITVALYAGSPSTAGQRNLTGHWGASATHAGGVTTLYAERFLPADIVGFYVQPDLCVPQSFLITGVSGRELTVSGNLVSLVQPGDTFAILAVVGVDPDTAAPYVGTLGTDSRYGWAGYFRLDPVEDQSGINLAGGWHAWNRNYVVGPDGLFGRWGTPDPAATPWANRQHYACSSPVGMFDPTGLVTVTGSSVTGPGTTAAGYEVGRTFTLEPPEAFGQGWRIMQRGTVRWHYVCCDNTSGDHLNAWIEVFFRRNGTARDTQRARSVRNAAGARCPGSDLYLLFQSSTLEVGYGKLTDPNGSDAESRHRAAHPNAPFFVANRPEHGASPVSGAPVEDATPGDLIAEFHPVFTWYLWYSEVFTCPPGSRMPSVPASGHTTCTTEEPDDEGTLHKRGTPSPWGG